MSYYKRHAFHRLERFKNGWMPNNIFRNEEVND
ncbi:BBE domain-containing protein [Megasphaera intestinihominis]